MQVDYCGQIAALSSTVHQLTHPLPAEEAANTLAAIYRLEKATRGQGDVESSTKLLQLVVAVCLAVGDAKLLQNSLLSCIKKKGQFSQSSVCMCEAALFSISNAFQGSFTKIPLLEALTKATEGKVFLEIERARATKALSDCYLADGRVAEAAACLIDLPVETFGSMEKQERLSLLICQLKLAFEAADYQMAGIILKKITARQLTGVDKVQFYRVKLQLDIRSANYLAAVGDCLVLCEEASSEEMLQNAVVYCILAEWDCAQQEQLLLLLADKEIAKLSVKAALVFFSTPEMIPVVTFLAQFSHLFPCNTLELLKLRIFEYVCVLGLLNLLFRISELLQNTFHTLNWPDWEILLAAILKWQKS